MKIFEANVIGIRKGNKNGRPWAIAYVTYPADNVDGHACADCFLPANLIDNVSVGDTVRGALINFRFNILDFS